LSHERVIKTFTRLGLSQIDAQVCVYLATEGPKKVGDIAKELRLHGYLLDLSLQSLQSKRIVNSKLETFNLIPSFTIRKGVRTARPSQYRDCKKN
jgi:predicted transcriptional regulator